MATPYDQYLAAIDEMAEQNGERYVIVEASATSSLLSVSRYVNIPEPGYSMSFSFGLSSVAHPQWTLSRPELILSVNSLDVSWALALGEVIKRGRGHHLFTYGTIVRFGERISSESGMTDFLVFANCLFDEEDSVVVLADRRIHWSQLHPIYHSEIDVIRHVGVQEFFFRRGVDFFDIGRPAMAE